MPAIKLSFPEPQATDRRLRRRVVLVRDSLPVLQKTRSRLTISTEKSRLVTDAMGNIPFSRGRAFMRVLPAAAPAGSRSRVFVSIDATPVTHFVDHLGCVISRVSRRCSKRGRQCRGNLLWIYFDRVVYAFWEHALPVPKKSPLTTFRKRFPPEH